MPDVLLDKHHIATLFLEAKMEPSVPKNDRNMDTMRLITAVLICGLTAKMGSASRATVTFDRDVFPILQKHCNSCHAPGRIGLMSFTTYEETYPWAAAIRAMVVNKKMPPQIAKDHPGLFGEDGRLSPTDVETIVQWVDAGAPEGTPPDAREQKRKIGNK